MTQQAVRIENGHSNIDCEGFSQRGPVQSVLYGLQNKVSSSQAMRSERGGARIL